MLTKPRLVMVESNGTYGRLMTQQAQASGLVRPVVLTRNPAWDPYAAADGLEVIRVETLVDQAVLQACARLGPVAGVGTGYEYMLPRAARVARWLDLPAQDAQALACCVDKWSQR